MPKFHFNPLTHTYTVDGIKRLSVTQCLPYNYRGDNVAAMAKGSYVHEMCRLHLLDDLNEGTLDPALVPYLDALKLFLYESKGMGLQGVIDIKSGATHPCVELQIAAYIELVNNGYPRRFDETLNTHSVLLEEPFYHETYQYCGTPDIVIQNGSKVTQGHALYLRDNGTYKLETIPNVRRNFEIFLQFLNTERWKREKGLT